MNLCKDFSKKYPVLLVVLSLALTFGLLELTSLLPDGPLSLGIRESIMAVVIFIVTFLCMGKEKVQFSAKGFGYTFRLFRGYLILMTIVTVIVVAGSILDNLEKNIDSSFQLTTFINILLAGFFVGIVEEFVFRGLIFGGLLQKLGNDKKSIILAAVISGLLFGLMHILGSALSGEITGIKAVVTAILKTAQTGIFGIVLAFVYYKTRNLFAVAALHSLDDFLLFIGSCMENKSPENYVVATGNIVPYIVIYSLFSLILVPHLVRSIKNLNEGEAIPFDEDFLPRKVKFEKKIK